MLAMLLLLLMAAATAGAASAAGSTAAEMKPPTGTSGWHALTNLQTSPAMVPGDAPASVRFHCAGMNETAANWVLSVFSANGTALFNMTGRGAGEAHLPLLGSGSPMPGACDGCLFTWQARFESSPAFESASACSVPPQTVFTAPWGGGHPAPPGMWAPDNSSGTGPQFAFLRAELPDALAGGKKKVDSALLFLTGDGPGRATGKPDGTRPLLGAYKAWLGESFVGMGPGRAACGLGDSTVVASPILCPRGLERVFDGYDVTALLADNSPHASANAPNASAPLSLFIEAYGYDQPVSSTQADPVLRRVAAELVVHFADGRYVITYFSLYSVYVQCKSFAKLTLVVLSTSLTAVRGAAARGASMTAMAAASGAAQRGAAQRGAAVAVTPSRLCCGPRMTLTRSTSRTSGRSAAVVTRAASLAARGAAPGTMRHMSTSTWGGCRHWQHHSITRAPGHRRITNGSQPRPRPRLTTLSCARSLPCRCCWRTPPRRSLLQVLFTHNRDEGF